MIAVEGLRLRQGDFAMTAGFEVAEGRIAALIGPSGGGKSTLLAALAGFVVPEGGRIHLAGQDMAGLAPAARPVTMVFQEANLFPDLDVAANVGLGRDPRLRLSAADRAEVAGSLAAVGLPGFGARRPGDLSGGERSRVALARALLRDRPVLLLDEPFAALGPGMRADMLDLTARIAAEKRMTVLMVTHLPEDARRIAETTILVAGGLAGPARPTADFLDAPPPALAAYLGR
ncbi:MAG: ATP-binding cassette domain-containing protein [Pseudomonadota bacterium]